jgi:hypothetical protein
MVHEIAYDSRVSPRASFPFYVSVPAKLVTERHWKNNGASPSLPIMTPTCRTWLEDSVGSQYIDWILASFSFGAQKYYRANFYFADKTKAALFALFWM